MYPDLPAMSHVHARYASYWKPIPGSALLTALLLSVAANAIVANAQSDPSGSFPEPIQSPEAGQVVQRFLPPEAYGAHRQNWDATQDTSGVLFVGNTEGVLIYDGIRWRTVPTSNESIVRSVAADDRGTVYVGAQRDVGAIRRDSVGGYRYVSLRNHIPEGDRAFTDVWRTHATSAGVYFQARQRLFRWDPDAQRMRTWRPPGSHFQVADVVRDTFFVNVEGEGLMTMQDDSLRLVPNGDVFATRTVWFVVPHAESGLLVGTSEGLFARREGTYRRFSTAVDTLLNDAWVYNGTHGPNGSIAIATIDRGVVLLAADGSLLRHFQVEDLPATDVYLDQERGLWAMLDGGLMRFDLAAPYTEHGTSQNLESVKRVVRHDGSLYVTTFEGVYRLVPASHGRATTEQVTSGQSWDLQSTDEGLLIAKSNGVYHYDGALLRHVIHAQHAYSFTRSVVDSSTVYVATNRGVHALERTPVGWRSRGPLPGMSTEARSMASSDDGTLWVGTNYDGLYRFRFADAANTADSTVSVRHYGTAHGLPLGSVEPQRWDERIVFGTARGVLRLVETPSGAAFKPVASIERPRLSERREQRRAGRPAGGIEGIQTGRTGEAWGRLEERPGRWVRRDTTWHWAPGPLHRLRERSVSSIYVEDEGEVVWMGSEEGLIRYVPGGRFPASPPVQIQQVRSRSPDSLVAVPATDAQAAVIDYEARDLRIVYSTSSLAHPDAVAYQYRLHGNGADAWSPWTPRTEYNLPSLIEGTYTFAVRARTAYGDTTESARYAFTILPPWYRTWWAYLGYVVGGTLLFVGGIRLRTRRLKERQQVLERKLEQTVAERTEEIRDKNEQLATQAQKLQSLDEAKNRFFANISHEFRTPLTLIRGPLQTLRARLNSGTLQASDVEQIEIAERNTERLQRLIDQILRLAQMDAGTYVLNARPMDVGAEVEHIARSFEPLAERRQLTLTIDTDAALDEANPVYVDPEALGYVVSNLLSNAIKFTSPGGSVDVRVETAPEAVVLVVRDTGIGISPDKQDVIFDRFAQADDTTTRTAEGAGIGLAFVSDLVDLHGGQIGVESAPGDGSTFTVRLRRGTEHFDAAQLDDSGSEQKTAASPPVDSPQNETATADDSTVPDDLLNEELPVADATNHDTTDAHGRRILIVDDNADVRSYVRSILEPTFEVVEAASGAEGLEVAHETLPDVILADVMMPRVDGLEMTRRLRTDPATAGLPIIMVTARTTVEDELAGLREGAIDYVTKPFSAEVLEQRIRGILAMQERLRRRLRAEAAQQEASQDDSSDDDAFPEDSPAEKTPAPDGGDGAVANAASPSEPSSFEARACAIIQRHLSDPDYSVADLTEALPVSRSTLYRRFDDAFGNSPSAVITEMRLTRATELLMQNEGTVFEVAYAVGFERVSSFSRAFRERFGMPPSEYQKAEGEDAA